MMKAFHFVRARRLHIQNEYLGTMPSDSGAYFLARSCHMNGTNMRGKAGYES